MGTGSSRRGFVTARGAGTRWSSNTARRGIYAAGALLLLAIAATRWWSWDSAAQPSARAPSTWHDTIGHASSSSNDAAATVASEPVADTQQPALTRESESSRPQVLSCGADFRALMECFDASLQRNLDDSQVRAMALSLDVKIDEALAARDVDPGEALRLKANILDVLELNPVSRGNALVAWLRAQPTFQVPLGEPGEGPVEDYRRGETALVAAWQWRRSDERDPEELANQLDRLMREALQLPVD